MRNSAVKHRRFGALLTLLAMLAGVVTFTALRPGAALGAEGTSRYVAVPQSRLVDTRLGQGAQRIDARTWRVQVAGTAGVPANATAVSISVAATGAWQSGHLLAYPAGAPLPNASMLNYQTGGTYSTSAIVALGAGGAIDVYTHSRVDFVIDITGAFEPAASATAGRFVGTTPERVLDSRTSQAFGARETRTLQLGARVPADATAVLASFTSTAPNVPGYFTAYGSEPRPLASTLNVSNQNSTRTTTAIVPIDSGVLRLYSSHGGHLVVDLLGHFTGPSATASDVGLYVPTEPTRRLDTRQQSRLQRGETRTVAAPTGGTVVGSITMVAPSRAGWGVGYASGTHRPAISSINIDDAYVLANMFVSRTTSAGIDLYSSTTSHYIFDQFGYFTADQVAPDQGAPATPPPGPSGPEPDPTPEPAPGATSTGQAGCTVSALLVPSCGAWLGAATTDLAESYDYAQGLREYEAVAQNAPDIMHFYRSNGGAFPSSTYTNLAHRSGQQRALMLINWKPSTQHTWRQIANGAADANIASAAEGMRRYPNKFFLTIWHEPENDIGADGSGKTAADYQAMFRYVVTKLRSLGVTNAVYVWNMMGYSGHGHLYNSLYPGHDVVDWIAYDPYSSKGKTFAELVNEDCCNAPNWDGFYSWATRTAPGKPLMMAEWGFNLLTNPNGPAALDGGVAALRDRFPAVKALVYWNEHGKGNYRLDQNTALGRAYGEAYRRFANDPYFNSTPTSAAP